MSSHFPVPGSTPSDFVHLLHYEDLVDDLEPTLEAVLRFLRVPGDERRMKVRKNLKGREHI